MFLDIFLVRGAAHNGLLNVRVPTVPFVVDSQTGVWQVFPLDVRYRIFLVETAPFPSE